MDGRSGQNWVRVRPVAHIEGVTAQARHLVSGGDTPRHVHHEYVFSLALEGATEIDCGHCGATHVLGPDDLLLTEAHEVYASRGLGKPPWRNLSLSVSEERLRALLDSAGDGKRLGLPHYTRGAVADDRLSRLFLKLHDALGEGRASLEQESLLLDWAVSLHRRYAFRGEHLPGRRIYSETAAVRRAREFIRAHAAENIRLRDLAGVAGLSPYHLNRAFSAQVGLPPHEYQNQLRVEEALRLIAQQIPLSEVAVATGFYDQSHFGRFFRRYTGVTPKGLLTR